MCEQTKVLKLRRDSGGMAFGQTATIQIRVWNITRFATWAGAFSAGEYAVSAPFNYTVPTADNIDPSKYCIDNLRAFPVSLSVGCIPEPSVFALGSVVWLCLQRTRAGERGRGNSGIREK